MQRKCRSGLVSFVKESPSVARCLVAGSLLISSMLCSDCIIIFILYMFMLTLIVLKLIAVGPMADPFFSLNGERLPLLLT